MQENTRMIGVNLESGSSSAIIVKVPHDLEDLIPGYLHNRENDIKTMTDKYAQGDYESIRILGHSIKGTGGSYGFDRITAIGSEIEEAARAMNTEGMSRGIEELADYIHKVRVVYE
jgi:HPt (histidine-containing phosphotransfer) domain-containing protein